MTYLLMFVSLINLIILVRYGFTIYNIKEEHQYLRKTFAANLELENKRYNELLQEVWRIKSNAEQNKTSSGTYDISRFEKGRNEKN